ncbi:FecR family protein [Desulfobacterium sp. N47]
MKALFLIVLFSSFVSAFSPVCEAASSGQIGIVKTLAGDVVIVRTDKTIKAEPNMKLKNGDLVSTGKDGKVGLIFDDDTIISMGSNSRIVIENFIFQPSEKKLSFIARFFQGTASFLSGQIAKLAPDMVHFEMPHATVGIRGTHFLVRVDNTD